MTLIEAVPLEYNGIQYRSSLEADWAAMFTSLGIYFEYEPQPWKLPSGAVYDCDFYLPNQHLYAEAKGPHNERLWKPREFSDALEEPEHPGAFEVILLRPAGPTGAATWESANSDVPPPLIECASCGHWAFVGTKPGIYHKRCRQCGAQKSARTVYLSPLSPYRSDYWTTVQMARAPRRRGR